MRGEAGVDAAGETAPASSSQPSPGAVTLLCGGPGLAEVNLCPAM